MSIEDFFSSTATVRVRGASNKFGKPASFTDGTPFACRFDPKTSKIMKDPEGKDVIVDGFVYLLPDNKPNAEDEIVVDGDTYRIIPEIGVKVQRGFSDVHHVKIAVRKL